MSTRYDGIPGSRVELDYSSMVSVYFFQTSLFDSGSSSELPRLSNVSFEQLSTIQNTLENVLNRPRTFGSVHWQDVVDLITSRYSERLQLLAGCADYDEILGLVNHLLNAFVDYGSSTPGLSSLEQCSVHYLQGIQCSTPEDLLIYDVLRKVNQRICQTLLEARKLLLGREIEDDILHEAHNRVLDLMKWLDWSDWKKCCKCALDEVCFVAMWPFGSEINHQKLSCLNAKEMKKRQGWGSYWRRGIQENLRQPF